MHHQHNGMKKRKKYVYDRAGFEMILDEQIEFASKIIEKYKLIYAKMQFMKKHLMTWQR